MQQRSIPVCIILSIITCGFYGVYWMIVLNEEGNYLARKPGTSGGLVFLFTLITCGIYEIYWMYQMGYAVELLHEQHGERKSNASIVYLLLSIFGLSIVAYALLQNEINRYIPHA